MGGGAPPPLLPQNAQHLSAGAAAAVRRSSFQAQEEDIRQGPAAPRQAPASRAVLALLVGVRASIIRRGRSATDAGGSSQPLVRLQPTSSGRLATSVMTDAMM